ncbi:MAG TPA: hypothetical protein DCR14_16755, partial [Acidimicrobiaceae bacterium]|nr:hypothetical protein [Acidimicrobiaceae bacterium]
MMCAVGTVDRSAWSMATMFSRSLKVGSTTTGRTTGDASPRTLLPHRYAAAAHAIGPGSPCRRRLRRPVAGHRPSCASRATASRGRGVRRPTGRRAARLHPPRSAHHRLVLPPRPCRAWRLGAGTLADEAAVAARGRVPAAGSLARVRLRVGALAGHPARRSATMMAAPATAEMDAEVLVIGSGAGGATTATVLAEAGFDVLVVEEGDWVPQGATVPFSLDQMDRQYRNGGVTVALGLPSVAYTEGRCAGGGTEINSGLYWRPPGDVLERWQRDFRIDDFDPAELLAIADEVEVELGVRTMPGDPNEPSERMRRGAAALGWRHGEIPRWMRYDEGAAGVRQSMTRTYLPRAARAGARLATGCRIDHLEMSGGTATAARTTLADGTRGTIRFRHVFVCGGAIQSPAILQRSRIRGHIGRSLAVHPTVKLAARFPDPLNIPDDVPVQQVKEFAPHLSFGGSASNPGLVALSLLDEWRGFRSAMIDWPRITVYYAAITSEGTGRVR